MCKAFEANGFKMIALVFEGSCRGFKGITDLKFLVEQSASDSLLRDAACAISRLSKGRGVDVVEWNAFLLQCPWVLSETL